MRVEIRLSEQDRERFGVGEVIDVDPESVTAREAIILQRGVQDPDGLCIQYDSPDQWRRALAGRSGDTDEQRRSSAYPAYLVLVWLALRRAGVRVPLAEVDFDDRAEWAVVDVPAVPDDPGKAQGYDPSTPEPTGTSSSGP